MTSATDRARFQRDGFFITPLLSQAEVFDLCSALSAMAATCDDLGQHPSGARFTVEKGSDPSDRVGRELGIRKYIDLGQALPAFWAVVRDARVRAILDDLHGPGARLLQSMALVKPPGIGSPKDWHQDSPYFPLDRVDEMVGVWIALDDATLENGCMQVIPGSHRAGSAPHVQGPTGWRLDDATVNGVCERITPLPMTAGQALIFDGNLWHFTDANRSRLRRRALQNHYLSARTAMKPGSAFQPYALDGVIPPYAAVARA